MCNVSTCKWLVSSDPGPCALGGAASDGGRQRQNPHCRSLERVTSVIRCTASSRQARNRPNGGLQTRRGSSRVRGARLGLSPAHDDQITARSNTHMHHRDALIPAGGQQRRRREAAQVAGGACFGRTALSGSTCLARTRAGRHNWGMAARTTSQVGMLTAALLPMGCVPPPRAVLCTPTPCGALACSRHRVGQCRVAELHRPASQRAHRGCGAAGRQQPALPGGASCVRSRGPRRTGGLVGRHTCGAAGCRAGAIILCG